MPIEVEGAEQLAALARRLKAADKELRREFYRSVNRAVKPLRTELKRSLRTRMPKRGGLARTAVRDTKVQVWRRAGARQAGIRVVAKSKRAVRSWDRGVISHPVYGHRGRWARQRVKRGWFTDPTEAAGPDVRAALLQAMRDTAEKIDRG